MRVFNHKTMNNDDEYYTLKEDVEKTLNLFDFSDKVVYCPCDSEEEDYRQKALERLNEC